MASFCKKEKGLHHEGHEAQEDIIFLHAASWPSWWIQ